MGGVERPPRHPTPPSPSSGRYGGGYTPRPRLGSSRMGHGRGTHILGLEPGTGPLWVPWALFFPPPLRKGRASDTGATEPQASIWPSPRGPTIKGSPPQACSRPLPRPLCVTSRVALVGPAAQAGRRPLMKWGMWGPLCPHSPGSSETISLEPVCHGPTSKDRRDRGEATWADLPGE